MSEIIVPQGPLVVGTTITVEVTGSPGTVNVELRDGEPGNLVTTLTVTIGQNGHGTATWTVVNTPDHVVFFSAVGYAPVARDIVEPS